jgi:hypothetical protein
VLTKAIRKWTLWSYFVQHIDCFSFYVIYNVHVEKLNPQLYHYLFKCSVYIDKRISNLAQLSLMPHYNIAVYSISKHKQTYQIEFATRRVPRGAWPVYTSMII